MPSKLSKEEINAKARAVYALKMANKVHPWSVRMDSAIREAARAAGLKTFFATGPCSAGHFERYVTDGKCAVCVRLRRAVFCQENPEVVKAQNAALFANNPGLQKVYAKRAYEAHKEKRQAENRDAYKNNREARLAYEAERRAANPSLYKTRDANKHARRKGAKGSRTLDEVKHLFQKQKGRCAYFGICGNKISMTKNGHHEDHITAIINGGSNYISNIQLTCGPCNMQKHAQDPLVFARRKGLLL